jgi:hypothetical protein
MRFFNAFCFLCISVGIFGQNSGLNQIINFDEQATLRNDILSLQQSSHDPTGGNDDGFSKGNFPGIHGNENIMLHVFGKGIVNRIWLTGYQSNDKLRIYFDGESYPTVDETVASFFAGTKAPFLAPLVVNDEVSSGGFISYLPFTFEESIMITTTGNHFYNIDYHIYENNNTDIVTWNGNEDLSQAYQILRNKGSEPGSDEEYSVASNNFNLAGGASETVLEVNEDNQCISGFFLTIPDLEYAQLLSNTITDNGKATNGSSQFVVDIDPDASQVLLTRRMDYWVGHQKANVFVDDEFAGEWYTPGENDIYRWKDAVFEIPGYLTNEKSQISVRIEFISSEIDWNEFYYWVYCDGDLTDEIDIGSNDSESVHSYSINPMSWSGSLNSAYVPSVVDSGRAHKGYSEFNLEINPEAEVFKLIRRMDYAIGNQKANVYVDDMNVGVWFNEGLNSQNRWADKVFIIPGESIPDDKEDVRIRIEFVSSDIDWNEFHYWMVCDEICTDEINIGDETDEAIHNYTIHNQVWEGVGSFSYNNEQYKKGNLLKNLTLQIFFDGEQNPSVDAPAGLFFGIGTMINSRFQSLPVGVSAEQNAMYCYFPMPFKKSFEIKLINENSHEMEGINLEVFYKPVSKEYLETAGYFKTQYNREYPPKPNQDYSILETSGKGKYVGVVLEVKDTDNNLWLEGDERFYIDGSRTPSFYGTGTEDYFNGAWYFNRGPFGLATHGFTAIDGADRTLYRFHLSDPVFFNQHARLGIEHGPVNDIFADYQSLAFYYLKDEEGFLLTDEIDIGDNTSEQDHKYQVNGPALLQNERSFQYEGDSDREIITETGYYIDGSTEFEVTVIPGNPVRIKRMFDYAIKDQRADVYVDDQFVGTWYSNGSNTSKRWREEFFMVPAEFVKSKSKIKLRFDAAYGNYNWSEFYYWIYSVGDGGPLSSNDRKSGKVIVFPNPTERFIRVSADENSVKSYMITDLMGRTIVYEQNEPGIIDMHNYPQGVYYLTIESEKGMHKSTAVVKR